MNVVQFKYTETTANQATAVITVTSTGAGNLLVIGGYTWNPSSATPHAITGVSDGTTAFTQVPNTDSGIISAGGERTRGSMWYLPSSNSGKTTITVTFDTSDTMFKGVYFWEVSGITNPVVDVASGGPNTSSGTDRIGIAVTPTSTADFIAAYFACNNCTAAPKAGNEFTSGGEISANNNAYVSLISSTMVSHQPIVTDSTASVLYATATAAFKSGATFNPKVASAFMEFF